MIRSTSLFFLLLPFVAATTYTYTPCESCTDRATTDILSKISVFLYTGQTTNDYKSVLIGRASDLIDDMDLEKPTVMYIFGWGESPSNSDSIVGIVSAYLKRQDHNVMLLNWEEIAAAKYDYSVASANGIGYTVASAIDNLIDAGLRPNSLHIVGHSLGAQISGYIGRHTDSKVQRITGLDPAGPSFTIPSQNLNSDDAVFVDIIHSSAGELGNTFSIATVDFFPNGGSSPQSGCEASNSLVASTCSHSRSWIYYAESVQDEDNFVGLKCDSFSKFKAGLCSSEETVLMGYAVPKTATGTFYLQTRSASPYGRKTEGTTYQA